jgi:hypothetical protein
MAFIAISLGVVWINRMCNPANPAFTMSEILRRQADAWVRVSHVFEADMSVVSDAAWNESQAVHLRQGFGGHPSLRIAPGLPPEAA